MSERRPEVRLAEDVVVVLIQPQHPGNVGSVARAMKNMGLWRLVVVDPPALDIERVRWMAPGCDDLIDAMRIVPDLLSALVGVQRVVGTTARHRKRGQPVVSPRDLAASVLDEQGVTAVLFGREDFGLSTADLQLCESILRIPTPEHASLNLSQAVLLVAHNLFEGARERGARAAGRTLGGSRGKVTTKAVERRGSPQDRVADVVQAEPAAQELVTLLELVGYMRGTSPDKVALTARQALQRARLSVRHVKALRGMVSRVRWALEHPDLDWRASRRR